MTEGAQTPSQIREAIIRGDWRNLDLYSAARP
jgi:hypothetical protein